NLVVVLGAGRLGILVALVSARLGAETIVADIDVKKLDLAGSVIDDIETCSVADTDKFIRYIHQRTNQLGADIVVEATGNPRALSLALNICRPRGTIALKSTPGVPQPVFDGTRTVVNEIRIQGSRCGPFDKAIQFIQTFKPQLTSLIAEVYPLHQIAQALKQATTCSKVLIKN
ncbi:MAG: zinc-binding dehydrogenase, partial [Candidatus Sumerlaeia bacterium]|nr:zinc-binding dehydrogenase [Candidatus Sumerlaeia bacterium]